MQSIINIIYSNLGFVYNTAHHWLNFDHLQVFKGVLCESSIVSIREILQEATYLTELHLIVHDALQHLCELVSDKAARTLKRLVLEISMHEEEGDIAKENALLALFLQRFSNLSKLVLHGHETWSGESGTLLATTLCPNLRSLDTLHVTGAMSVDESVLDAIERTCPDLSSLAIDLTNVKSPHTLCKLKKLTECFFTAEDAGDLKFVRFLSTVRVLHVWLEHEIGNILKLPQGLREFRCYNCNDNDSPFIVHLASDYVPMSTLHVLEVPASHLSTCPTWLLANLQSLKCQVEPEDVCLVLDLVATGLPDLKELHLVGNFETKEETLRRLGAANFSSHIVCLVLENFSYDTAGVLSWLRVFPDLMELKLQGGRTYGDPDLKRVEVFQTCLKLKSLFDTSTGAVVTVGKTEEGRLIKRMHDRVSELTI
jgi:hypothetical protein